jgi:hypothetical protein
MELGYSVIEGLRPAKPGNAAAIGFSDSLWEFAQRCWDGNMRLRPKVTEVAAHLGEAAANWCGVMAPCVRVGNIASDSEEPMSDTMAHCKSENLTPHLYFPLNDSTGPIFQPSSGVIPESPTDSQVTSGLFSRSSTPSTQCTELSQEKSQEVVAKPFEGSRTEPRAHLWLRLQKPHDDLHVAEIYPHLHQRYDPPPSRLPQETRKGFKYLQSKFREVFRLRC